MSLQRILFISLLFFVTGIMNPTQAAIATVDHVKNEKTSISNKKAKKLSFRDKVKLIKKIRAERRAAMKAAPKGTKSIMQNRLFVFGLILLAAGIVVGALGIPIISWIAGVVALAGFIMMIIALVNDYM